MDDRDTAHPATMNATKSQARNLQLDPCNFFMRWANSNLWKDMVLTFGHQSPVMISLKFHQKPSINSRCSLQRSPAKPSVTVKLQLLLDSTTSIVVWKSLVQQDILAGKNMDEMMKLIMRMDFMWIKWRCEGYACLKHVDQAPLPKNPKSSGDQNLLVYCCLQFFHLRQRQMPQSTRPVSPCFSAQLHS